MTFKRSLPKLSRRGFFKLGAGLAAAAGGAYAAPRALIKPAVAQAPAVRTVPDQHLVATDGWINIPGPQLPATARPENAFHPDPYAPAGLTTYMFGFTDVTDITRGRGRFAAWSPQERADYINSQKMQALHTAPWVGVDQEADFWLKLTNVGLAMRPDLTDAHTVHWHGFKNAIPMFDGEPHSSMGVSVGSDLMYYYRPHDPGTYMYHCHVEETEHIHMGMTGVAYVRALQNRGSADPLFQARYPGVTGIPAGRYAYNDLVPPADPRSTRYDREYLLIFTEVWAYMHWCDAHIQLVDWTDYKADFYLINGRAYPDTLLPNGDPHDPANFGTRLQYQPHSALVQANAGERVLLRVVNLGFQPITVTLPGLKMRAVGRDASPLRGLVGGIRAGADFSLRTNALSMGSGETWDVIVEAPAAVTPTAVDDQGRGYQPYLLYNRNLQQTTNGDLDGSYGGQMTELRVYPAGALGPQTDANQLV